jgi:excisionase family DNA binding protein
MAALVFGILALARVIVPAALFAVVAAMARSVVAVEPALLRIPEVAQVLGLSRAKTYALIAAGELGPVIRIGTASRLRTVDVYSWINQRAEAARAEQAAADEQQAGE